MRGKMLPIGYALRMLTAAIALSASPDASANFIGVTDARSIEVTAGTDNYGGCFGNSSDSPDSSFAAFEAMVNVCHDYSFPYPSGGLFIVQQDGPRASQTSSFSSTTLQGSGSVSISHGAGRATASSTYSITFEVDSSTPFTLDGQLFARMLGGSSRISLMRGTETLFSLYNNSFPEPLLPFSTSGVLAAGQYQLLVQSDSFVCCGGGIGPFSYEFELQAIPEPQSLLLLGAGLAVLACHRRPPLSHY